MLKFLLGFVVILVLMVIGMLAIGYQPTVYLMPTPAVMSTGDLNPFDINPNLEKSNALRILYATNRIPAGGPENRTYTIFPGNKLHMGIAHMRIGRQDTSWENIFNLSTTAEKGRRPAIRLEEMHELVQYRLKGNVGAQSDDVRAMANMVNEALERSIDKDITIYVHGANTAIFRACAQAAQYHHFTGRNSVVLAYLWPSAENLFAYGTDARHALRSAPAFARLLTLLAEHTHAKNINILAYSAGALIVSPALDIVGRDTQASERKGLRVGQVYYAAADIGVQTFVSQLQHYIDIPVSTTLAINMKDSVLSLSARRNKESRAGRPSKYDLSPDEDQWVRNASMEPGLSLIGINAETVSGMKSRSHDFWYSHPWISSDVLTQFLFHKAPQERGLVEAKKDGLHYWFFPPDYPDRIVDIVEAAAAKHRVKIH